MVIDQIQAQNAAPETWEKADNVVTHNDVIDAYIKGKEVGKDESRRAMLKVFEENLDKACETSEKFLEEARDLGIDISSMHLKAQNSTDFVTLVITSEDCYVDEKFLIAIRKASQIKRDVNSEDFTLNFLYTYLSDSFEEHCLEADGYFLKYHAKPE